MSLKNPVTRPGIDPGTVGLVAQRLNHYANPGPNTQYIPITKDEFKSRLTAAITRGAQSGYGELLLEQR
jgi:hypothetical protein